MDERILPSITQFPIPTAASEPLGITRGPDGNLWFAELHAIGRITPAGVVTEFTQGLSSASEPTEITVGPDGNLWFTEEQTDKIGRISVAGAITEFSTGNAAGGIVNGIAAGADGNLWFTVQSGAIGRITPAGAVTLFTLGITAPTQLSLITRGPDGNLWVADGGGKIDRITPTGVITEFTAGITSGSHPSGISTGPDGNLWFTEDNGNRIGRITTAGVVTEFSAGITPNSLPTEITTGPDGNLWFTEFGTDRIVRITPLGVVTEFSAGITAASGPEGIAVGPDGNLWFTELNGNRIGRLDLPQAAPTTTALGTSTSTVVFGQTELLTATVKTLAGVPAGAVTFKDGTVVLGSAPLNVAGQATLTVSLGVGAHTLTASFTAAGAFAGSTSAALTQTVNPAATDTALGASANSVSTGVTVTFTATVAAVAPGAGTPTGSVTFKDGNTVLGTAALGAGGTATLAISFSTPGIHSVTALYNGSGNFLSGTSAALAETVVRPAAITELPIPTVDAQPLGITRGPDGNLWFAELHAIGRITPAGIITEFTQGLSAGSLPIQITAGPDGNLWFTEGGTDKIGRITPAGVITEFAVPPLASNPFGAQLFVFGITAGPDGNLWFTEQAGAIGRITTAGVVTVFTTGVTGGSPQLITAGPDGNLWFADGTDRIGRITPAGVVTKFSTGISFGSHPFGIAPGPDGNLWFTEDGANGGGRVGRITTAGVITEFSAGITAGADPEGISAGPDGNLWFTEIIGDRIGRITTAGAVTEFSAGITTGASPAQIAVGADGNLWFTESAGNRIGRLATSAVSIQATHFRVVTSSSQTAGQNFSYTVTALAADGSIAPLFTGTVHFTSTDPQAVLPADYTFVAADAGVHTFSASLKSAGNQTISAIGTVPGPISGGSSTFAVFTPITVQGVQINDGAVQRSTITSITISFSRAVGTVDPGAFQVLAQGGGNPTVLVSFNASRTAATLTFTGALVIGGSLQDGRYSLVTDSTKIHDATGGLLDGNGDGLSGGARAADAFFRLFGDSDGDGDVDNLDLLRFRQAFGLDRSSAGYKSYFDFDGDGDVDNLDLFRLRQRLGTTLAPQAHSPAVFQGSLPATIVSSPHIRIGGLDA
jgi:streptogramin lyase